MADENDHDLLIEMRTKMNIMLDNQDKIGQRFDGLSTRVAALEVKDNRDSERIGNVIDAVKASTNNSTRIAEAHSRIDTIKAEYDTKLDELTKQMDSIQKKGNWYDALNAVGVVLSTIL